MHSALDCWSVAATKCVTQCSVWKVAGGGPWGEIEWVCFTSRWHSCLFKRLLPPLLWLQITKFWEQINLAPSGSSLSPSDTVTAWLIASGCTLRSLTLLFCKSKVEKKWLGFGNFSFPPKRSKLTSAQWEGFSYCLVKHGCGLARECIELVVKSMIGSRPRYCKTPDSLWNHGQAVPHS